MKKRIAIIISLLAVFVIATAVFADESAVPFDLQDIRAYLGKMFGGINKDINSLQSRVDNLENQNHQLHLYDANGQDLGILIRTGFFETFLPNEKVIIEFQGAQVVGMNAGFGRVYYLQPNCVGAPYFDLTIRPHDLLAYSSISRFFTYYGDPIISGHAYSKLEDNGTCGGADYNHDFSPLIEIALPFTLPLGSPFHIQ